MTANVYQAINAVQADLAKVGITKDHRNQQQGYNFRGIDDVYNVLSPLLARHGLCILPRINSRTCEERKNSKGNALFYVTVEAEFDFVSSADGSKHVVKTYGEAMDSADKATNKAMSAAYKYAAFQAFAIPTVGDNDADATTHVVVHEATELFADFENEWLPKLRDAAMQGEMALRSAFKAMPASPEKDALWTAHSVQLKAAAKAAEVAA